MPKSGTASIEELELDPLNPRLPDMNSERSQEDLLRVMARDYALIELARSFADNGYFKEEPLVTIRRGDKLRVVEGNRRLAALRILSNPALVEEMGLPAEWTELSAKWLDRAEPIPVMIYDDPVEITPFLGFRHISGVKKWEPVEKARFINSLVEPGDKSFAEVARIVGGRAAAMRLNFIAYRILGQASEEYGLETARMKDRFGVFLRALSSGPIRQHLGLVADDRPPEELLKPIQEDHSENLAEIISWIFGTTSTNPVIRESRQITDLGFVLANPDALETLRSTGDFQLAHSLTEGEEVSLLDNLRKASYNLDEAKRDIDRHTESERVRELVSRCRRSMDSIITLLDAEAETHAS